MATAFQSNAFQNNAFQISGGPLPSIIPNTHDTFKATPDQYKKYRERLQALSEASEKFQQRKYVQKEQITEQIEAIETLDEEVKEQVLEASTEQQAQLTQQFYDGLHAKLVTEITMLHEIFAMQQDEDDITTLLLSGGL